MAADEKYRVLNRDNLTIPIQMILSEKQKRFSEFFVGFLKSRLNLKHFEKKDDANRFCISKITVEIFLTAPLSYWLITAK